MNVERVARRLDVDRLLQGGTATLDDDRGLGGQARCDEQEGWADHRGIVHQVADPRGGERTGVGRGRKRESVHVQARSMAW